MALEDVTVYPRDPSVLGPVIGSDLLADLVSAAGVTRERLDGNTIWNVNSTAAGGGVAEMLHSLLSYVLAAGIDTRWVVIPGDPEFFTITKRIHNGLHDSPGDGGELGPAEHSHYEQVVTPSADELANRVSPGDIVLLHDPQTAGMVPRLKETGATVVWRSHIGYEGKAPIVERTWEFLRPYLEPADWFVFSREAYAPAYVPRDKLTVIWPSLDPFSVKNQELSDDVVLAIAQQAGLIQGTPETDPLFKRSDGSEGRVERKADVVCTELPTADDDLVIQVSRWDALKDMPGVMEGFVGRVPREIDAKLMLIGPSTAGVTDDPEGLAVYEDCVKIWNDLDAEDQARVLLVSLPMDDLEENAAMVNAIQRLARIVVQKSIVEGFGLTVSEAMWKSRPVVASRVGGIQDQIIDGSDGILLDDPRDLAVYGDALRGLLEDPPAIVEMGSNAKQRALHNFLGNRHLIQYAELFGMLLTR